jgi:two-component system, LuxR family, sensor kinase FixL
MFHHKNKELDKFFNVSIDLLCVANTDGYFVRLNHSFESILGYTTQELMAKPFLEFVHPDDRDATREVMATLNSQQILNNFSNRFRCKDDSYRWLEWRAVPSGTLIYAAARDITERKRAEEGVKKSEKKYRNLYESMMDGFVLVSMDGLIREYNESYKEMTGYTSEELIKLTYHDLTPEKWHSFEQVIVDEQVLTRGYSDVYEKEYRKKDGTIFPVELRTFLLRDETGTSAGMWAIIRDITERKFAALALEGQLCFERLVSDLSARFVNIAPDQVDAEIEQGLKQILQFFQVERCALIRIFPDKGVWQATHAVVNEGTPPVPVGEEIPVALFPYGYDKLVNKRQVHFFSKLDDLPAEAHIDKQTSLEWGIRSCLYIPVMIADPLVQLIAIDSITGEQIWPEELIPRLRLVGEIFTNALERKQTRLQLERRFQFERLISDLSAQLVNVQPDEIDRAIIKWLRAITEFFDADRCTIGLFSDDGSRLERAFEYHSKNAEPAVESISKEQMPWYIGQLLYGNQVVINRVEDLPSEAEKERQICLVKGMKSVLSIPLISGGVTLGSFALVSTRSERTWPEELVQRFRSVSEVFANALLHRRSEMMLRTSEEKFRQFFSHIPEYCYIIGPDGTILAVNDQALNALGYEREELIGKPFAMLYAPESLPRIMDHLNRWEERGEIENEEMVVITKTGEKRVVLLNAGAVRNKHGAIIQAAAVQRDVTEQKKVEAEALSVRRELWRTDRLLRMGELTASLAHELNQPLTSILSNARAALRFIEADRLDTEELKEILEDISRDDRRAGDIIRSLRSMVRPEEGEREVMEINDLLGETVVLFNSEAIIRNIEIKDVFADSLQPIRANRVQLQQVVINLLMNAAESMIDERENRKIVVETSLGANDRVRVSIRDFGAGIDEQELNRIFEPFFTTKRSGLGMGLSLGRSIIEAHAGRIWAENNPDKGTTFYFELPGLRQ